MCVVVKYIYIYIYIYIYNHKLDTQAMSGIIHMRLITLVASL